MRELKKAVFLDRDGVINKWEKGDTGTDADWYILGWDQFEFLPGVMEAFFELYQMDYEVFVVSNQSGISKDLEYGDEPVTVKTIYKLFEKMDEQIVNSVRDRISRDKFKLLLPDTRNYYNMRSVLAGFARMVIRDFTFCRHLPEHNCACRKPKPGMIYALALKWEIDLSRSWMIGDKDSDIEAGYKSGIRKVVKIEADTDDCTPPYEQGTYKGRNLETQDVIFIHPTLLEAVHFIQDVDKWEEENE